MVFTSLETLKKKSPHLFPEYIRARIKNLYTSHIRRYDYILITENEMVKTNDEKELLFALSDASMLCARLINNTDGNTTVIYVDIWSPKSLIENIRKRYEEEDD